MAGRRVFLAALVTSVGPLLAAWGVFIHLNRSAEELEPEATEKARAEDRKVPPCCVLFSPYYDLVISAISKTI